MFPFKYLFSLHQLTNVFKFLMSLLRVGCLTSLPLWRMNLSMTFWVNRKYYLGDRIEVAKEKLLFDENFFEMVDCVNNTANDLIHPDRYETVNLDDDKVC